MNEEELSKSAAIVNLTALIKDELRLRNDRFNTIESDSSCLRSFIQYFQPPHPRELTDKDMRGRLLYLLKAKQIAPATLNQVFSAKILVI